MAKPNVTMTLDRLPEVLEAMRMLTNEKVYVGVPDKEDGRGDGPIGNAAIGYINENGSPKKNIPARPHLRPGVERVRNEVAEELGAGARALLTGRPDAVRTSYNRAGIIAVNSVKGIIRTSDGLVKLSDATLERRKNRKRAPRKGEKPLLDTAQYMNSITYVIRKR
jgi:hypothetical protein